MTSRWLALLALIPALAFADGNGANQYQPPPEAPDPSGYNRPKAPVEVPPAEMDGSEPDTRHEMGDAEHSADTMLDWGKYGVGLIKDLKELQTSYQALSDFDQNCVDTTGLGAPDVPASCAETNAQCGACYSEAIRKLNGTRLALEKLHCFYTANKRFIDAAVSFGDNASGIHAVTGIEWQHERAGIMKELDKFNANYDNTLKTTLVFLRKDLDAIAECEMKFYSNSDWYSRFGYLYYGFMSDRYKR